MQKNHPTMQTLNRFSILLTVLLLALTTACNHCAAADYRLDYTVSPDTAGHYLNVSLTCQTDSTLRHPTEQQKKFLSAMNLED